jgi:hypothetical protein
MAADKTAGVCDVLNALSSFRNQVAALEGEVAGSFRHGFVLVPRGHPEVCPGWPEWGLTRLAAVALLFRPDGKHSLRIPPEFQHLSEEKYSGRRPKS